jgi:hypothetical protein
MQCYRKSNEETMSKFLALKIVVSNAGQMYWLKFSWDNATKLATTLRSRYM